MDWSVLNQWQRDRNQIELQIKTGQTGTKGGLTFNENSSTSWLLLFLSDYISRETVKRLTRSAVGSYLTSMSWQFIRHVESMKKQL